MKEFSISLWECGEGNCKYETEVTYQDIEISGIPMCPFCDSELSFISEKWVIKDESIPDGSKFEGI
jgi:hypothetical protein